MTCPSLSIQRCRECVLPILPTGSPDAGAGLCELCCASKQRPQSAVPEISADAAEPVVERIRRLGRGRPFDCVVGMSGGRDSTWLIHLLVRQFKLRCLGAYYFTPFTPEEVRQNVERAAVRLGVPTVPMNISPAKHLATARRMFQRWLKRPSPALTNLACMTCKLVNRELLRTASRMRVRSLVVGGGPHETVPFLAGAPRSSEQAARATGLSTQFKRTAAIIWGGVETLAREPGLLLDLPGAVGALMYLNVHTPFLRLRHPRIYRVDFFFHYPWNEAKCLQTVQSELGWQCPPGCLDTWRCDCTFADLKDYMYRKMIGLTYREAMLANQVRCGQITRDQALARLAEGIVSESRVLQAIERLGISPEVIDWNLVRQ